MCAPVRDRGCSRAAGLNRRGAVIDISFSSWLLGAHRDARTEGSRAMIGRDVEIQLRYSRVALVKFIVGDRRTAPIDV